MSAAAIRRGSQTRSAKAAKRTKSAKKAPIVRNGDNAVLNSRQLHRLFITLIFAIGIAALFLVASIFGLPALISGHFAQVSADAGFAVHQIHIRGLENMNRQVVNERVFRERGRPMTEVSINALRDDLLGLPWVREARISRQLPDTLIVNVVERKPRAVLRRADGKLALIDVMGHQLEQISPGNVGARLVVQGAGVTDHVAELDRLLASVPSLQKKVREAEWIGHRRWNLTFASNQILTLPEGEAEAGRAFGKFAQLNARNNLLNGKAAVFDMRSSDRMYMRIPGRGQELATLAREPR